MTKIEALLKRSEVATMLRVTTRTVQNLPIPIVKVGSRVFYDPIDIKNYIKESKQCLSIKGKGRHSGTTNSKSKDVGFEQALRQQTKEKQSA